MKSWTAETEFGILIRPSEEMSLGDSSIALCAFSGMVLKQADNETREQQRERWTDWMVVYLTMRSSRLLLRDLEVSRVDYCLDSYSSFSLLSVRGVRLLSRRFCPSCFDTWPVFP